MNVMLAERSLLCPYLVIAGQNEEKKTVENVAEIHWPVIVSSQRLGTVRSLAVLQSIV